MPLVKVVRNGQITIPKKVRSLLGIHEGDFLEIQVSGKSMLIKPKIALERDLSGKEFFRLTEEMRENVKGADPDELDQAVVEATRAAKAATAKKIKARTK